MKRIFWLLPLVLFSVLALGLLAWSLAERAEDQTLAIQRRQHEALVRECKRKFKDKAHLLSNRLCQWAGSAEALAADSLPPNIGQAWTVVFDIDGRWWYPTLYSDRRPTTQAVDRNADARWGEQLAEAARQEHASPTAELAANTYAALDRDDVPPAVRAAAILGLARCANRQGRVGQAGRLYRRVMNEFSGVVDDAGANLGAEAGISRFRLAQDDGDAEFVVQAWREYSDALLEERFAMPWATALSRLTDVLAQVPLAADAPQDVDRRQKLNLAIGRLNQMGYATTTLPLSSIVDTPHLTELDEMLLLARRVPQTQPARFVVTAVPMDFVRRSLVGPLVDELTRSGTCRLCIQDNTSHEEVAGEPIPPGPLEPAEASLLDWGLAWTISAGFVDLPALQAAAAQRRMILTGSIAGLVVLIGAGTVLSFRMVRREMELSQLKSDFVDNVSHELRTPVTSIKLFSQMLCTGQVIDSDRQREYHRLLASESDRLMRMVENMLDFSRIVAGRIRLHPEPVDVTEYLEELLRQLQIQTRPTGHRIHLHLGLDLPRCMLDRDAMSRAVANLVSNAIKYSAKDREIVLTAQRRDGKLSIMVRDRGVGIPPQDLPHVFDRFYRARHGDTDHIQGTGLGLTIVRDTVERHGGRVRIDSRLGEGTVVELLVPIHPGANRP